MLQIARPTSAMQRPVILVVDDDPVNRRIATLYVSKMGCTSREAAHGAAAMDVLRITTIDLILMDMGMPIMNGIEATKRIRAMELGTGSRVPVLGFSGFSMEADRRAGLDAGMDDYITKPIDPHRLSLTLQYWLPGRTHPYGQGSAAEAQLPDPVIGAV